MYTYTWKSNILKCCLQTKWKSLGPQNIFTTSCHNYDVTECDWKKKNGKSMWKW